MGTLIENILSRKAGRRVYSGERLVVEVDTIMSHDTTTRWAIDEFEGFGVPFVRHPERVVIPYDHAFPAPNKNIEEYHRIIREFADKHQITEVYDNVPLGISHQVLPERGHVRPGNIIIGGDSHSCTYGAFAAYGFGVGSTEIAAAWVSGQAWIRPVPKTYLVHIGGKLGRGVYAKDVVLEACRQVGLGGATDMVLEYSGSVVKRFLMDERMTLSNMAVEMGASSGLIESDKITIEWLSPRTKKELVRIGADSDAEYARRGDIDVSYLEPLVACPPTPDNVSPVSEVGAIDVDRVFIGTCTDSRASDWEIVHRILQGKKVKTPTLMTPASLEVWQEVEGRGYVDDLREAGVQFEKTGCSACLGRIKVFPNDGDVVVTTMNRNFPGRMGADAKVYLASPATAAASALRGKLISEVDLNG